MRLQVLVDVFAVVSEIQGVGVRHDFPSLVGPARDMRQEPRSLHLVEKQLSLMLAVALFGLGQQGLLVPSLGPDGLPGVCTPALMMSALTGLGRSTQAVFRLGDT
jgi:hypothetical protein